MGLIQRIRTWYCLRKSRKEEQMNLPTEKEVLRSHRDFLSESKQLKPMITRKQSKNI